MLAVENRTVVMANQSAQKLYGSELIGKPARRMLPDHILDHQAEEFVCSAEVCDKSFSASVRRVGETQYVSLKPLEQPRDTGDFISGFLMNSLLSSLFNVGTTIDLLYKDFNGKMDAKLQKRLSMLNHNYFCLRHSILNLNTVLALKKNTLYIDRRPIDLYRVCNDLVGTVRRITVGIGISLEFDSSIDYLLTELDTELTERIILNILCNSFSHTPRGGTVSMRLDKSGDNAVISIDDKGDGIPAELMGNIFSRYEEPLGPETLSHPSTGGLGLGIARGLAEKQGGALIIESRKGAGTSVRILLPLRLSGRLQLGSEGLIPRNCGMKGILTEFAWILDAGYFSEKYTD